MGNEYDAWTNEGILEAYWGEHIHLGYYTEQVSTIAACVLHASRCSGPVSQPNHKMLLLLNNCRNELQGTRRRTSKLQSSIL